MPMLHLSETNHIIFHWREFVKGIVSKHLWSDLNVFFCEVVWVELVLFDKDNRLLQQICGPYILKGFMPFFMYMTGGFLNISYCIWPVRQKVKFQPWHYSVSADTAVGNRYWYLERINGIWTQLVLTAFSSTHRVNMEKKRIMVLQHLLRASLPSCLITGATQIERKSQHPLHPATCQW